MQIGEGGGVIFNCGNGFGSDFFQLLAFDLIGFGEDNAVGDGGFIEQCHQFNVGVFQAMAGVDENEYAS